jgi:uncharacterized protein
VKALYLETSALARAYLHADRDVHAVLGKAIEEADVVVTSALTGVELRRAAAQLVAQHPEEAERAAELLRLALEVLAKADVHLLNEDVLALAGGPFPLPIRTLDALHVATAQRVSLRREVTALTVLSRDKRVRDVVAALGMSNV